jgi:hypothetical protein
MLALGPSFWRAPLAEPGQGAPGDRFGIRTAIASIGSPGVWFGDAAVARDLARLCKEYYAGVVREHPTRFGAFACLPLPDTGAAVAEAVYRSTRSSATGSTCWPAWRTASSAIRSSRS